MPPKSRTPSKSRDSNRGKLVLGVVALLSAIVGLLYKILPSAPPPSPHNLRPAPAPTAAASPRAGTGRLSGSLTDRADKPVSQMIVGLQNGPEARTDEEGRFVLNGIPAGDQTVVVRSQSVNAGRLTRNIDIAEEGTTEVNIIYDQLTSQLALLSVGAPVDGGQLVVQKDGTEHHATVHGHFDGLGQIIGSFDIWVLIQSERDHHLWVQRQPAIPDNHAHTWKAYVTLGDATHPPHDGEKWDIVAVAADSTSNIRNLTDTPSLSHLPPHISSNLVTAVVKIVEVKRP
jgi:hypothetical protein